MPLLKKSFLKYLHSKKKLVRHQSNPDGFWGGDFCWFFCCCGWLVGWLLLRGFFCREGREKFHIDFVQQVKRDFLHAPELYLLFVLKS